MTDPAPPDRRALLQQALVALDEMQAKLDAAEAARREPIAIVGMGCRFPGGATSLDAYWELLCSGRDAITTYPADRAELVRASGVDVDGLGDSSGWYGGFLTGIDQFDPQFFGIAPREAATMDPQQRLLLEVTWEALEHAGIAPTSLGGSATGVFVGITGNEYVQLGKLGGAAALDVYSATGGALNAAAGRVAYTLGLQGPAMAIDTACSSSLVALHQACQSLRTGETTMALAGGVNMLLLPEAFVCFEQWGMMAPDGRCKTFDVAADGFVRGEGCGVVVLKLLRDALADGDRVLAVVRGSAVNQDGASSGLTVPNGPAQQAVLRSALAAAGVAPADVQYFEAHGTGTSLGDPIEVEAVGAVLRRGRGADQPLVMGSVKTNIGHLESAAGIAGLIKVVLSIEHGLIPPNLHFREPNPDIPWPSFPVVVPTTVTPWPGVEGRRVAGVSGFGFSGTNAHVVVESPPVPVSPAGSVADDAGEPRLLVLSGRTGEAAREVAGRWASALAVPGVDLDEVVATGARGRAHLSHRLAVVDASVGGMRSKLEAYATGEAGHGDAAVTSGRAGRPSVAFVFSGQGSQWVGMGRGLYGVESVFRGALDRCAGLWEGVVEGPGLLEVLWGGGGLLGLTEFTQPALFALGWSLVELWGSWGVVPGVVLGHSVGEFVAGVVAGVFSLEDGFRLVAARGRLMGGLPAGGVMVAVMAPVSVVEGVLAGLPEGLVGLVGVAAVNGVAHTVVSGAVAAVDVVVGVFEGRGVRVSRLVVSHAFHSPLMVPVVEAFGEVAAGVGFSVPSRRFVSNVSGGVGGVEVGSAAYWVEHVVAPVRFGDGVGVLRGLGVDVFVEVGPHPVLVGMVAADGVGAGEVWVGSLRRGRGDREQVLGALAGVHVAGVDVAWDRVVGAGAGSGRVVLPTTPFQRHHHWLPSVTGRSAHRAPAGAHPLLGTRVHAPALQATIHESEVRPDVPAWIADHRLSGTVVLPGSAYLEMFVAASDRAVEVVDHVRIQEALVLTDDAVVTLQTVVQEHAGGRDAQIVSVQPPPEGGDGAPGWTVHARAVLRRDEARPPARALDVAGLPAAFIDEVDVEEYYALLRSIGLTYGPTFRGLTTLRRREGAAVGLASLPPDAVDAGRYHLHPALLDACFHVLGVAVAPIGEHDSDDMLVPVAVDGLRVVGHAGNSVWCVVTVVDGGAGRPTISARVELFDHTGAPVATIDRLEVRRTPRSVWERAAAARHPLYEVAWRAQPHPDVPGEPGRCLVVAGGPGAGEQLAARLDAAGFVTTVAVPGPVTAMVGPARWTLRDDDAEGLRRLVGEVLDAGAAEVVYLWPPADADVERLEADALDAETARGLGGALLLAQALAERADEGHLWFVTRGAQSAEGEAPSPAPAALWGFGRVLLNEQPQLACRLLDLDPNEPADAFDDAVAELLGDGAPEQVAYRGHQRLVGRLTRSRVGERTGREPPYRLALAERGSLEHLALLPATRRAPGPGEVEVEVRATGISVRDVQDMLGTSPGGPGLPGVECAGVVVGVGEPVDGALGELAPGDHVMGIAPNAFDSHVITERRLLVRMPAGLTFAEAATTPTAFLIAADGLRQLAALRRGERILVHAAAGGVAQAAVQLAQRIGAEVHATAGSPAERRHLEALGVRHIYGSPTVDLAAEIRAATAGDGVDVVLGSLADDPGGRTFDALAQGGRFLEIGNARHVDRRARRRGPTRRDLPPVRRRRPHGRRRQRPRLAAGRRRRPRGRPHPPAAGARVPRRRRRGGVPLRGRGAPRLQGRRDTPPDGARHPTRRHLPRHRRSRRHRPGARRLARRARGGQRRPHRSPAPDPGDHRRARCAHRRRGGRPRRHGGRGVRRRRQRPAGRGADDRHAVARDLPRRRDRRRRGPRRADVGAHAGRDGAEGQRGCAPR